MSDRSMTGQDPQGESPFDELMADAGAAAGESSFATVFRGYDREQVDEAISSLNARIRTEMDRASSAEAERRRAEEDAAARTRAQIERLEEDLAAANARAGNAEQQVQALTEELIDAGGESTNRNRFEEVLRVAEDQASLLIKNASIQADRLLEAAREEIRNRRAEAEAEAQDIRARAEHDAQQVRLRIDTELTAHKAEIEREAAHAAEKVAQAEQEAATIRTEADRGAAALRSMVARETADARTEAEDVVRDLRLRALEFEESLTRRQDDAQQEFLTLHNQAVAHAERITRDANDQVAASLDHAQRVATKADDFDRLMRAEAQQITADAHMRAGEHLERAQAKAQKIIDTVTMHTQSVLRDAEDRTRQLRWQQHQLTSFMAEVKELIRPEGPLGDGPVPDAAPAAPAGSEADEHVAEGDESFLGDEPLDDEAFVEESETR